MLCQRFPHIYSIASDKNTIVVEIWRGGDNGGSWEIHFNCHAQDWELEAFADFCNSLYRCRPANMKDSMRWKGCPSGSFSVKSYYKKFTLAGGIENVPYRQVWHKNAPLKVCFFVWKAVWSQVLTINNLSR